jgi:hypothetical protein
MLFMSSLSLFAQDSQSTTSLGEGTYLGKSIPLRDFPLMEEAQGGKSNYKIIPNNFPVNGYEHPNSLPVGGDPIRQSEVNIADQMRNLEVSFDGPNSAQSQSVPPDPTGAVGPNHYVSGVNVAIMVFDKEGNTLAGPTSLGNFIGDGQNSGDPIIMYDQLADRWFVSQFNIGTNGLAIAISETPDPTGAYFLYEFPLDAFPDYPHYSVWHDAYYLTANKFTGANIYALERDVMIAGGQNPQIQGFNLPGVVNNPNTVFSPEPAYLLGEDFDPDTPGYITYLQDDQWSAAITFDHLKVWELDIDFDTPGNSSISAPLEIPVAPFDSFIAPFGTGELQQPGTNQRIDMITGVISYAAHYRPFEDHNSWLVTFNVDVQEDNTTAGVRWIELRNSDTEDWSVFQEGTYAPDDGNSRFMGSGAIDAQGNIGLAFNIGSAELPVGVAYTGRFSDDPLGEMTIAEETIIDGLGVQTGTNRFGDYSQLSMDPDNFTFWHIAEYFSSNNFWTSRIGAFSLSNGFPNDIGVTSINTPNDGLLTATESVEVSIRNFGSEEKTDADVQLSLDGTIIATETFTGTIAPGESVNYTFAQTLDLSIEDQTYLLEATTIFPEDEFNANDATSRMVRHTFVNDVGVAEIIAPQSADDLTMAEAVTVTVTNFGSSAQSNFDISLDLDGVVTTETITATIASQESLEYTFTQTLDLSDPQDYVITVTTALAGDQDPSNDAMTMSINSFLCQPVSGCSAFNDGVTQIALADQDFMVDCDGTSEGYTDNTDIVFNFVLGNNPFNGVLQMGFADSVYALWIDFNDNNTFEPDEIISNEFVAQAGTDFAFTIDFNDFPNATEGEHLMRLRGEDESTLGDVLDPCGDLQFGRTNDFTANVTGVLGIEDQQINNGELTVSTLPNNNFDIQLNTEFDGKLFMAVFNIAGQQLAYKPVAQTAGGFRINLDMSATAAGVYLVRLGSSNPNTFQTAKIIVQ